MQRRWEKIGKVGRAYGLQGAFYVGGRSNLLPEHYQSVVVGEDPEKGLATEIVSYRIYKERAVLRLAAFEDRSAMEAFVGQSLWAPCSSDEVDLYSTLIGRAVVDSEGQLLGYVHDFYNHGASDNVEIAADNGQFLEVPFVEDYFHQEDRARKDQPLKLKCPASHFADLWHSLS